MKGCREVVSSASGIGAWKQQLGFVWQWRSGLQIGAWWAGFVALFLSHEHSHFLQTEGSYLSYQNSGCSNYPQKCIALS